MNQFVYWATCPTCGKCLCRLIWTKTKFSTLDGKSFIFKYECKLEHKFKTKFK